MNNNQNTVVMLHNEPAERRRSTAIHGTNLVRSTLTASLSEADRLKRTHSLKISAQKCVADISRGVPAFECLTKALASDQLSDESLHAMAQAVANQVRVNLALDVSLLVRRAEPHAAGSMTSTRGRP